MRASILPLLFLLAGCAQQDVTSTSTPDEEVPLTLDTAILGTTWSEQLDPDRDCKFRTGQGWLVIEMPGNDHDLRPEGKKANAPRLLKEVEGDFDAQVRVQVPTKLSEESAAEGQPAYVCAGLLLVLDNSLIRFEFGRSRESGRGTYWVEHNFHAIGRIGSIWGTPPKEVDTFWLRLERRGSRLRSQYGADGERWSTIYPNYERTFFALKKAKVKIGLFAASTSSEPFTPRFDHWKLTPVIVQQAKGD